MKIFPFVLTERSFSDERKKGENVIKNPNAQKREEQYGNVAVTDLMTTFTH